ncbi:hypothetical protein G5V57_24355 [Nordella sp. HKS 07]|uniref:hypothetical protein n=1 Tax=Nordella sp. HKS 07 TaxID=2712222 RepID=UPI0013E14B57|nr:hypothetical protein [Nordella sp. HKS 07]QIG50585.1 hypothetical protein G5V57_24355 [Nordella sp. HKS 07]
MSVSPESVHEFIAIDGTVTPAGFAALQLLEELHRAREREAQANSYAAREAAQAAARKATSAIAALTGIRALRRRRALAALVNLAADSKHAQHVEEITMNSSDDYPQVKAWLQTPAGRVCLTALARYQAALERETRATSTAETIAAQDDALAAYELMVAACEFTGEEAKT